jgi:phage/plasmid-associated DNA primase
VPDGFLILWNVWVLQRNISLSRISPKERGGSVTGIDIPQPLALAGARFVLIGKQSKIAIEKEWESTNNYDASSPRLLEHLKSGGNYGVLSHNGICVIDIDNPEEFKKLDPNIPKTFAVRRGTSGNGHIYFTCPDCPENMRKKFETPFGDIRMGGNFYVVAPGSTHPTGDTYEMVWDTPIITLPWLEVERLIQSKPRAHVETGGVFNLPTEIHEGHNGSNTGRNTTLFKYGCSLRARGLDDGEVQNLIRDANNKRCRPTPLQEDEISTLIRSVLDYKKGSVVVADRMFPKSPPPKEQKSISNQNEYDIPSGCIEIFESQKTGVKTTKLNVAMYADFLTNLFSIKYFNKVLYIYDHGDHYYRPQTNEIETHTRDTIIRYGVSDKLPTIIIEVKAHLTAMGCFTDYPFNRDGDKIPVENGIVKINYETGETELLSHSPEHMFTYKLAVKFDKSIKNCDIIPLLERMVEKKDIRALIQIPAQALLQMQMGHSFKKAYLLQGEPHAGKTSYLKLLYRLFGDDFTTAISLQQLCENHFVGGALEGKLLNIYDDLEDVALNVIDQFKTLTGDCRHGIERKYEAIYTGKITAVHIFTCNYPPEYPEKIKRDAAFWARWEYLKFPYAYPVNPNFYSEWYTDERISSFFNLILGAMIHIRRRGLLANSDIQEVMMLWSINSDPLYDFIGSIFDPYNGSITTKLFLSKVKLFELYTRWCIENDIPEHKRRTTLKGFTTALQAHRFSPERKREKTETYETYTTSSYVVKSHLKLDLDYHTSISDWAT